MTSRTSYESSKGYKSIRLGPSPILPSPPNQGGNKNLIVRPRNDLRDAARDFRAINSVNPSVLAHKSLLIVKFFLVYQAGNRS